MDESQTNWDYSCPQFCDFTSSDIWARNEDMDSFFTIDHEKDETSQEVTLNNVTINDSNYQTPRQHSADKENIEGEEEDVYYSTKKSLTIERRSAYKLRVTPMRSLQQNGLTPLRETGNHASAKKKRRNKVKRSQSQNTTDIVNETALVLNDLMQSLVIAEQIDIVCESHKIEIENVVDSVEPAENKDTDETEEFIDAENEQIENNSSARRLSYVIENHLHGKCVTVVTPTKPLGSDSNCGNSALFKKPALRRYTPRRGLLKSNKKRMPLSAAKPYAAKFKSMAELLNEFENKPRDCERWRSLNKNSCSDRSRSSSVSSLTRPVSPKLHALQRHRSCTAQSYEDMIEQQIKSYSFKANPIKKKLFDSKFASGIPRIKSVKNSTKAVGIDLNTEKRNQVWKEKQTTNESEEQSKKLFRAKPMPTFKQTTMIAVKPVKKITTFKPFSFDQRDKMFFKK